MSSVSKKITYVITQGHWGGAQRYVFDLASTLQERHRVDVLIGGPTNLELQGRLSAAGVPWKPLRHLVRQINPLRDVAAVLELRRQLLATAPDIIHLNSSKAGVVGSLAVATLPRAARPKVIYTAHGWVFVEPLSRVRLAAYRWLEKLTARWKDKIVCVSEVSREDAVLAKVGKPSQLVVVPTGLDYDHLDLLPEPQARAELRRLAGLPPTGPELLVVCVANYYATKGIDILMNAAVTLRGSTPLAHSIVIGDGPLRGSLLKQRAALGLESIVHLPGAVPLAHRLLTGADVVVLPSRKEGLPYALLEALAARRPIVASEVGGMPAVLGLGRFGLLVRPAAAGDLAAAISRLLADEPLRRKLGEATAQAARNYTLDAMARATEALYSQT